MAKRCCCSQINRILLLFVTHTQIIPNNETFYIIKWIFYSIIVIIIIIISVLIQATSWESFSHTGRRQWIALFSLYDLFTHFSSQRKFSSYLCKLFCTYACEWKKIGKMQTFRVLCHDLKWVNKAYKLKRAIKVESNF